MGDVGLLAGPPRRLRHRVGVSAGPHDARHAWAEAFGDHCLLVDTGILDGVVKQASHRLLLIAAMVQHEAGNSEQMRDVRNARTLTGLPCVDRDCEARRVRQASPEFSIVVGVRCIHAVERG